VKIIIKRGAKKKIPPSSTGYDKYVATFPCTKINDDEVEIVARPPPNVAEGR